MITVKGHWHRQCLKAQGNANTISMSRNLLVKEQHLHSRFHIPDEAKLLAGHSPFKLSQIRFIWLSSHQSVQDPLASNPAYPSAMHPARE